MKKLLFTLTVCGLMFASSLDGFSQAKIKVVESSAKKTPAWIGATQSEYIITSAIAPTLEQAKRDCMEQIRKQIIRSVAENVEVTSSGTVDQQIMNSEIVSFLDSFSSTYKTQSADVPFLTGVSESKVEEYYWEKRQDKKTKEVSYLYSVKYPFPSLELKKLVNEFNKKDSQMWQSYLNLEKVYGSVSSLEQIDRAIVELGRLSSYFFDNTRKNATMSLMKNYRDLYNGVSFKTVSDKLGEYRFRLMLNGSPITTSQRITAKSQDDMRFDVEHDGSDIVVRYNVSGAEYNVENTVTTSVKIGGKTVPHKFSFTVRKAGAKIWADGTVYLTALNQADSLSSKVDVRMHVKSQRGTEFVIKDILLDIPGVSAPMFIDNINQKISKSEQTISITYMGNLAINATQYGKLNMLRGYMLIEIPSEDVETRIDFSLPFKANW